MLRAYFVENQWLDCGIGVIANTGREAKKLAFGDDALMDSKYIDLRVKWIKNVNIEGLEKGVIRADKPALLRGIYSSLYNFKCDECGEIKQVEEFNGKVVCEDCYEKLVFGQEVV